MLSVFLIYFLFGRVLAQVPGASMVLTNNGVLAAANFATPLLQAELMKLTLPDQKFNEVLVDIHLNDIHVSQVTVGASAAATADALDAVSAASSASERVETKRMRLAHACGRCIVRSMRAEAEEAMKRMRASLSRCAQ